LAQFELDVELPEKYQCNGFTHSHFTAQLQESEGAQSALGMSAVLARAAASTHEILDSHRHNSSLEATIHKVKHDGLRRTVEWYRPCSLTVAA